MLNYLMRDAGGWAELYLVQQHNEEKMTVGQQFKSQELSQSRSYFILIWKGEN